LESDIKLTAVEAVIFGYIHEYSDFFG